MVPGTVSRAPDMNLTRNSERSILRLPSSGRVRVEEKYLVCIVSVHFLAPILIKDRESWEKNRPILK